MKDKKRNCPLHKEDLLKGKKIKYSHWFVSYFDGKSFFEAQKELFPRANAIKVVSSSRPEKEYISGYFCKSCRKNMYNWFQENVTEDEYFKELQTLLKEEI